MGFFVAFAVLFGGGAAGLFFGAFGDQFACDAFGRLGSLFGAVIVLLCGGCVVGLGFKRERQREAETQEEEKKRTCKLLHRVLGILCPT